MKKLGTLVATAAVAVVCFAASEARADLTIVQIGTPYQTNSWVDRLNITGQGTATTLTLNIAVVSNAFGSVFEFLNNTAVNFDADGNAANGLQPNGWTQTGSSTNVISDINGVSGFRTIVLTGNATSTLSFDINLTSPLGTGFSITAVTNTGTTGTFTLASTIPLPAAAWAGMAMLAGMGVVAVKRRRNRVVLD